MVVKLGGSAITNKSSFEELDAAALQDTAAAVARSNLASEMVVLHGAGSFGHFQASQYGVSKGIQDARFSWRGFAETRSSVTRLNAHVVSALLREGLPACALSPFPRWSTRIKGHVVTDGIADVRAALDAGLLPVLHGDAVFDSAQGCSILSGDTLIVALCAALRVERAIFLTDVAGVYDRPPQHAGATLLPRIWVDGHGQIVGIRGEGDTAAAAAVPLTSSAAHDVTGGLAGKLQAAAQCAAGGTPVIICQVGTKHAHAALAGEWPEVCTVIARKSWDW